MANPKWKRVIIYADTNVMEIILERDVTDSLNNTVTREDVEIRGALSDLTGLGALRNNLLAWIAAKTGFQGTIDNP